MAKPFNDKVYLAKENAKKKKMTMMLNNRNMQLSILKTK